MAIRNTPPNFTFEEWRVEFNELATDVGDIDIMESSIDGTSVSNVIEAVNALYSAIYQSGFTLAADSGSPENLVLGDTLTIEGTANEIETFVYSKDEILLEDGNSLLLEASRDELLAEDGGSIIFEDGGRILFEVNPNVDSKLLLDSPQKSDTITIGLPSDVTITNNLSVGGNVDVSGNVDVVGNITLGGNITIGDQDVDSVNFNADIVSDLVPDTDNIILEDGDYLLKEDNFKLIPHDTVTYDLGTEGKPWGNLHLAGSIYDDNGNQFQLPISSGQLATTGFGIALAVALG